MNKWALTTINYICVIVSAMVERRYIKYID